MDHDSCGISTGATGAVKDKLDILQGTLDLMVLRTLSTLGPLHGYGIARRIEQVSGDQVILNQGTIYTSLVRLQQRGWIRSRWGTSENNRRARYYAITRSGEKQLIAQTEYWERLAAVMGRVLANGRSEG
jgi:PadR family transcriptional regulator